MVIVAEDKLLISAIEDWFDGERRPVEGLRCITPFEYKGLWNDRSSSKPNPGVVGVGSGGVGSPEEIVTASVLDCIDVDKVAVRGHDFAGIGIAEDDGVDLANLRGVLLVLL